MKRGRNAAARLLLALPARTVFTLFLASAAIMVLSFAVPLTVLQTYDRIIAHSSRATLAWLSLGCLAALALDALMSYGRDALCAWTASRFSIEADRRLAGRLLDAEPETVASEDGRIHLERLRSAGGAVAAVLSRSLPVAAEAPFALAYLAILLLVGKQAAWVPIGTALLEFAVALALRPWYRSLVDGAEAAERDRIGYIGHSLDRLHFIKSQAIERMAIRGFEARQAAETRARAARVAFDRRMEEFGRLMSGAATFGLVIAGGILVTRGELGYGAVSAMLFFALRFVAITRDIRKTVFVLADAGSTLAEAERGMDLPARSGAGEPALPRDVEGRLEFEAVSYGTELRSLSFVLRPGEAALVRGTSREAGSAVCRLAAGILEPSAGLVLVDAYPSTRWDFRRSPGVVGYVSSRSSVLPGSVLDNVAAFDPARREAALDASQVFGLDRIVAKLPMGFETPIGPSDSGGLSASALRLVTVARALAIRPRVLAWDEADADLDAEARAACLAVLSELKGSMSLVLHTSAPDFTALADSVIDTDREGSRP